jgi:uncharacterized protein YndB with AHSA1/START domain
MTRFATSVRIGVPIEVVYAYLADPLNLPHWNSAVQAVQPAPGSDAETGSTYTMDRALPSGNVRNALEVVARERPTGFGIRTTSGPTPFTYRYQLSTEGAETVLRLDATVTFDDASSRFAPLLARVVKHGVDANLALLKHTLERS